MRSGAGLWAWIIPPLVLLAALAIIIGWWKSRRPDPVNMEAERSSITDDEREQVAHAMRKWQDAGEEEI